MGKHPAIQVRVMSVEPVDPVRCVAQGSADLGLTFNFQSPVRKGVLVLADIPCPMHVVVTPDHELATRPSVTLEECGAYPLIYQDDSGSVGVFLGREMEVFKQGHEPILVSNTLALMKQLLLDGSGIAFFTRLGFMEELDSGRLVAVPIQNEVLASLKVCLLVSSDRLPTVAVQMMSAHLEAELARYSDQWQRQAPLRPSCPAHV